MNREKAEAEHRKRIRAYEREIKRIYTSLVDEAAKIGTSVKNFDKSKPFRFDDYPQTRKRIEKLFDDYRTEVLATISGGIDNEFTKQNEFFLSVLRGYFSVPDNYYSPVNKKAVEAFIERKNNGMNLSQRVWKYSGQFKEELEMSIDLGLREGRSAQQMSRDIRKYLNNPDKLFRRVRDEHGNLQLSKNAKAFHPGAGVYRSSYKNAVRLTGTETNIAYRTADYDSIQTEDFVLGIRIELSNNHTTNGKPLTDICDELKGVYPKDFKFTGWHPNCRCKVITINASIDEVIDHIKNGTPYKGYITDTPPNFKKWVAENQEKLQTTNSLPYFVRDNEKYFPQMTITPKAMAGVKEAQSFNDEMQELTRKPTALEIAQTRHANRTAEQIADIQKRADDRQERLRQYSLLQKQSESVISAAKQYSGDVDYEKLSQMLNKTKDKKVYVNSEMSELKQDMQNVVKQIQEQKTLEKKLADIIPDVHQWHKQVSISELKEVHTKVSEKLNQLLTLPIEKQASKLKFEANEYLGGNMNNVQSKFPKTWQISQAAYLKKLDEVNSVIALNDVKTQLKTIEKWSIAHLKSKKVASLLKEAQNAISNGDELSVIQQKAKLASLEYQKRLAEQARRDIKKGEIVFKEINKNEIKKLLDDFKTNDIMKIDERMRKETENLWKILTEEEKIVLTKYTQTYSYLNERLRGIGYYGDRPIEEFEKDLPILTNALNKFKATKNMVVRRGTKNFFIPELNKDLNMVNVGEEFVDKGFLSTAVHRTKGFNEYMEMIIVVPKDARGVFAEPFTRYNDSGKYDFEKNIWNGTSKETLGSEFEWIGQRGSKFKVLNVSGRTIYLQLIGQLK